jgi:hypothetical protein
MMSVETVLASVGNDLKGFYTKLSSDFKKARQAWVIISSAQTRALLLTIGSDVIKMVKDVTAAGTAKGFSLTLDEVVVEDIQQLIADAKAGDGVLIADLKTLGITL